MSGPVWSGDFPDPFVLPVPGGFAAYGTNAAGRHVQVLRSPDLRTWHPEPSALPQLPGWAQAGFTWSPAVLDRGDFFVLYVTVREPRSGRQAIAVATAGSPWGPFVSDESGPLVFQPDLGGSIDPSVFADRDGQVYLLWKSDGNAVHRPSSLWAQPLSDDGLSLVGDAVRLLGNEVGWEDPLIEAPSMVLDGGRYYLFYSAGRWASPSYAVGYATGPHPLGPWERATVDRPWFGSGPGVSGPGGQELFRHPAGGWAMAYHGWEPGRVTYRAGGVRTLRLAHVSFADGRPVVDGPLPGTQDGPPPATGGGRGQV